MPQPLEQEGLIYSDDLTGFYNRRYLYAQLPQLIEDARGKNQALWVFMMDIDNFKSVNDTYGHLSGDQVIKDVSLILKDNTKAHDKRVRYAGDEFTLIVMNVDAAAVVPIGERLLEKIEKHHFKGIHSGKEIRVSMSVGIAGFPQDSDQPVELINLADKALYVSKQKGKNCVSTVSEIREDIFWKKDLLDKFPCPVFIDREKEKEILKDALAKAGRSESQVVFITGGLGAGKTRLLVEFEHSVETQGPVCLSVKGNEKFMSQPYYGIGEALDSYLLRLSALPLEFLDGLSPQQRLALVNFMPALKNLMPDTQQKNEEAGPQDELNSALVRLLANISRYRLLCFFFDDMQYFDEQSIETLTALFKDNPKARLLLAATFSSGRLAMSDAQELPLAPLNLESVQEMITSIFTNVPLKAELTDIIYAKTAGNPLFIEELLKYLVENEFVVCDKGAWKQQEIKPEALPSSLEDVIKSRLESLDDETKEMITKAAVIGEDFEVDILHKIDSEDRGYVLDLIEAAKKVGLVYEKGSKGKDQFSFVTGEIRNILFNLISSERQRHLHSRMGQIKENMYQDKVNTIAGELYYHFKKAEDQARAQQYARVVKEGKASFVDTTVKYAESILEESTKEKIILPLSPRAWNIVPSIIRSLYLASVNFVLYPPQSKVRQQSVEDALKIINDILSEVDALQISCVESTIFINRKKLVKGLPSFFFNSFVSLFKGMNIASISFLKGLEIPEMLALLGIISKPEASGQGAGEDLKQAGVVHIQIEEVSFDAARRQASKERMELQDIMLIDYLMGKIPMGNNKADLPFTISNHAREIADSLDALGEKIAQDSGKDKEAAKSEVMARSIQKLGHELLDKDPDNWSKYKEGLAKTVLAMKPEIQKEVLSSASGSEGPEGMDVMREISNGIPDEIISELIADQYGHKDADIKGLRALAQRFLNNPEKRKKLAPAIKDKLKAMGATDEECEWIFEPEAWDKLPLEKKIYKILTLPSPDLLKILPMIKIDRLIEEIIKANLPKELDAVEDRLTGIFSEHPQAHAQLSGCYHQMLEAYLAHNPEKFLANFLQRLLRFVTNEEFPLLFYNVINPHFDKVIGILLALNKISIIKQIFTMYSEDTRNSQEFSTVLDSAVVQEIVDELIKRIELNLDWSELSAIVVLLQDKGAKLLLENALFQTGVPEGKYFEAYLRRRTIGKILSQMPKESLLGVLAKERFVDSPPYLTKNLIEVIGAIESEELVSILEIPLRDKEPGIRKKVIFALSKMKGKASARLLIEALKDSDSSMRQAALQALKSRKDEAAHSVVKECANDKSLSDELRLQLGDLAL